jgi:hypothetical protein
MFFHEQQAENREKGDQSWSKKAKKILEDVGAFLEHFGDED